MLCAVHPQARYGARPRLVDSCGGGDAVRENRSTMSTPQTVRVFIAGASGSGKSTAAWRHYLQHFPRRILLDFTGEWDQHADMRVSSVYELSQAIRKLASSG